MRDTETLALPSLSPAEIDEAWTKAIAPAATLEARRQKLYTWIPEAQEEADRWPTIPHYTERVIKLENELVEVDRQIEEAWEAEKPYRAEWNRRGGWTRYYLVAGGHLHEQGCFTIHPGRTLVGLLCQASGLTPAQVVETFEYTACTHCFPDAPVAAQLTPEQQGICPHSGEDATAPENFASPRYAEEWWRYAVAPSVRCECGWRGAITKSGKFRKHKPGRTD